MKKKEIQINTKGGESWSIRSSARIVYYNAKYFISKAKI